MTTGKIGRPKAVIFDMDGTLFETDTLLVNVHERVFKTLREEGLYLAETPPVDKMLASLGMILDDLWKQVMPGASEAARQRADVLLLQYELEGLVAGEGQLYPHVKETLEALHADGIKLFVASNGLEDYVKGVALHKEIAPLFEGLYSAGEFETASKVDLVAKLMNDHGLQAGDAWMVGDRSSDVEAGKSNGLKAIACAYAQYGRDSELEGADVHIHDFKSLLNLY
ncbi:HAD family hydrolase [Paenibacillus sp. GCM10027627]|uniref:HAD family hydrolase n=1 Tax=unclassified Paenibacillus TaxID=185978 RepID=UPI00363AF462